MVHIRARIYSFVVGYMASEFVIKRLTCDEVFEAVPLLNSVISKAHVACVQGDFVFSVLVGVAKNCGDGSWR